MKHNALRFRRFIITFSGLTLAGLAACGVQVEVGPAQPEPTSTDCAESETGSVSGTVTDKDGNPLADCEVSLSSCCVVTHRTRTDKNGRFVFPCVEPDPYTIQVWCPGKLVPGRGLDVKAGENRELHLKEHTPPAPPEAGAPDGQAPEAGPDAGTGTPDAAAPDPAAPSAQCAGLGDQSACLSCCEGSATSADAYESCVAANCV